jgi:hypothetical protein
VAIADSEMETTTGVRGEPEGEAVEGGAVEGTPGDVECADDADDSGDDEEEDEAIGDDGDGCEGVGAFGRFD